MFTHQPTTVAAREYIIVNYAPYTKAVHALGGYNTFILVVAGFIEGQSHVGASGLRVLTQIITSAKIGKRVVGAQDKVCNWSIQVIFSNFSFLEPSRTNQK